MHTRSLELAIDLIHAMADRGTLSVVAAKEAVCGSTIPATDFRRALAYAQGAAWIQYDRDFLSITLTAHGHGAVQECRAARYGRRLAEAPPRSGIRCLARTDVDPNSDALGAFRERWACGS